MMRAALEEVLRDVVADVRRTVTALVERVEKIDRKHQATLAKP
jgi:hypothetical protein